MYTYHNLTPPPYPTYVRPCYRGKSHIYLGGSKQGGYVEGDSCIDLFHYNFGACAVIFKVRSTGIGGQRENRQRGLVQSEVWRRRGNITVVFTTATVGRRRLKTVDRVCHLIAFRWVQKCEDATAKNAMGASNPTTGVCRAKLKSLLTSLQVWHGHQRF